MGIGDTELQKDFDNLKIKKRPKTFLQVLGKTYNEGLVSNFISYFLDERNTKRDVIMKILSMTSKNKDDAFINLLEDSIFESIENEVSISSKSRIDIIIKYSNFWIVIENKIFAHESKANQTIDYEREIERLNNKKLPIKFIYLKPRFNESNPSNSNFTELLYDDVLNILEKLSEDDLKDKEDFLYLQDFIKHIKEFLMQNNQIIDEQAILFYVNNKEKIDYIAKQQDNVLNLIVESIENEFPLPYKVHQTLSYIQIYKESWDNKGKTGIHFEILPNRSFNALVDNKPTRLKFCLHNEQTTKDKYPSIQKVDYCVENFLFNSVENIQNSIQDILKILHELVEKYEKTIDDTFSKKQ